MSDGACSVCERSLPVLDRSVTGVLRFAEHAPPEDLREWIEAVGVVTVPRAAPRRRWRMIADARTRLWLPLTDGALAAFRPASLQPRDEGTPPVGTSVMVRFAPWATRALGTRSEMRQWWVRSARAWGRWRTEVASDAYAAVSEWLRLMLPATPPDVRAMVTWRRVAEDPPVAAPEIADALGVGTRTLRRIVRRNAGCALRTIREIERFRAALRLLRRDLVRSWTSVALAAGYCDQSHLYGGFARWVGMSPGRFFAHGHHHLNDVFVRQVERHSDGLTLTGLGAPALRTSMPPQVVLRDRRSARAALLRHCADRCYLRSLPSR